VILKILVTGGTGFLGKKIISHLLKEPEYELTCVSRVSNESSSKINWVRGDLSDLDFVECLDFSEYEQIFHLAWEGLPNRSAYYSQKNYNISLNLIQRITKYTDIELNIVGSCLEYGDITGIVSEEIRPDGTDDFAKAKISLYRVIQELGVQYRWFRPFFMYGEGQSDQSLIPNLISKLKNNLPIQIKSMSNSHDFICVEDVANAIVKASRTDYSFGDYNLGTGASTSVGEIVELFHQELDVEFNMEYTKNLGLISDSKKIEQQIGWHPEFIGLAGIKNYYKSIDNYL
jgi:nucleoside-diphosphate-sugar epimerase